MKAEPTATTGDDNYTRHNEVAMMTWGESACLIYRWPCLKALQTPTERPAGMRERERKGEERKVKEGGWEKLEEGAHIPCCRAKEMHGHALFSKACRGVIHKEHGWSNTAACAEKRWESWRNRWMIGRALTKALLLILYCYVELLSNNFRLVYTLIKALHIFPLIYS